LVAGALRRRLRREAEKAQRKAESRERMRSVIDESRRAESEKRTQVLTAMLQPDESVLALTTAEALNANAL
jgi:hypothetical protein